MKFQHFFQSPPNLIKTCRIYWNHHQKTCMWNLSPFREVKFFYRKMLTVPALEILWKFHNFFKFHQISSNLQNILESSSETYMWNLSLFRDVIFFTEKCWHGPRNTIKFHHFFQNSPNFIKLAEHIGIIIRKHTCVFHVYTIIIWPPPPPPTINKICQPWIRIVCDIYMFWVIELSWHCIPLSKYLSRIFGGGSIYYTIIIILFIYWPPIHPNLIWAINIDIVPSKIYKWLKW